MSEPDSLGAATAGAFWRRALQALAHVFEPGRETEREDSVFQTRPADRPIKAPTQAERSARLVNPPEETLQ